MVEVEPDNTDPNAIDLQAIRQSGAPSVANMTVRSLPHPTPAAAPRGPVGARRHRRYLAALVVCAIAPAAASAEVYKCRGDGARPVYQEMPCPAGQELRNFQVDPPEITVLPGVTKSNGAAPPPTNGRASKDNGHDKTAKPRTEKPKGDPAERGHLHTGMTEGEVLTRVGPPNATTGQKNAKLVRWTWFPVEGDPETVTTVTLSSGVVVNVDRMHVKR